MSNLRIIVYSDIVLEYEILKRRFIKDARGFREKFCRDKNFLGSSRFSMIGKVNVNRQQTCRHPARDDRS